MYKLSSVVPMIAPMNNSKPLVIRYEINIKLKNRMHILFRFSVKIFSLHRETDTYLKSQKFPAPVDRFIPKSFLPTFRAGSKMFWARGLSDCAVLPRGTHKKAKVKSIHVTTNTLNNEIANCQEMSKVIFLAFGRFPLYIC